MGTYARKQRPVCFGHDYLDPSLACETCLWSILCYLKTHEIDDDEGRSSEDIQCIICDRKKEDPVSLYCDHCWGNIFDKIAQEAI